ncbi:MAG: phosphoglucosamine mutase [Leuconostoc gelidum]|jgi:phosphoglucosamine mutase|uniref:Phosphoglucosamine mutase n=1 Tax=Leuconostoc gelidum subsp. gelidum TaxID=1607839 RepID=A0AB35FY49_LEUGE|nr:phosphoglucosamine mutase [Leuconostoc gelidum]MBZ5977938.1 phosphoglucosamine mutase [Leuconostoc gelidum subsp. gelidum]MBZ6001663.1 phosphoglucosamine mutase [Leuconostoc gelidum subsp. gelidum]MBZ6015509.1 phosphoglucosamine mutase [Leuconostoc gelidum subsp. gelidum]QDJ30213.1 phosphoglucosamine mutase [Leuconostoc gelidum subsp. gelidum]
MSDIKLKYFGTDGVRGIANESLTPELAFRLGRTGGAILTQHAENHKKPVVIVGRDTRISGEMLQQAIVAGFLSVGIDVLSLGVITTPAVAFLVQNLEADAGVQITASHNPAADNGIKFFGNDGFKLSDELEYEIEQLLDAPTDILPRPSAEGIGVVNNYPEGALRYMSFLQKTIPTDLVGMRVALDGANGATSGLLARLFADLNVEFVTMGTEPNGLNINDGVGSTHPEALAELVKANDVQAGLSFDGDGDRLIAVDENGEIVDGDKIMFIIGKFMNEQGRLKHHTVVSTIMSNIGFYKALTDNDMMSVQTAVGDRYVMEEMSKSDYNLGGEQSGHIIFRDWATTGDGLLTALQLLYVMKETGTKLSELAEAVQVYPQKLVNIKVGDKVAIQQNPAVVSKIAEVEAQMAGDGRVLVRPSGTESLIRVMAEAPTTELVERYVEMIAAVVREQAMQ